MCGSTVEKGGVAGAEFSADVTFSQWFCSLINVCSSLQSLLCLFERNIALQPTIQGHLGDLYEQNDVSVSNKHNNDCNDEPTLIKEQNH